MQLYISAICISVKVVYKILLLENAQKKKIFKYKSIMRLSLDLLPFCVCTLHINLPPYTSLVID